MSLRQRNLEVLQRFPLHPVASETAAFTGATTNIADLQALDGDISISLDSTSGGAGTQTLAVKIQHSDTITAGDFSDVDGGAFTTVTTTASFQVLTLNRDDLKRYIRLVTTQGAGSTYTYSCRGLGVAKYQ
jgi:hypothetical protein